MDFAEYSRLASETAIYPDRGKGTLVAINYVALGAAGEAGEMAGKVKKIWRGDKTPLDARAGILDEAGDTLWYLNALAIEYGTTLEAIAEGNIAKLQSRRERGVTKGDGDNR